MILCRAILHVANKIQGASNHFLHQVKHQISLITDELLTNKKVVGFGTISSLLLSVKIVVTLGTCHPPAKNTSVLS